MSHQTTDHLLAPEAMSLLQVVRSPLKQNFHGTLTKISIKFRRLFFLRSLG